jgi:type IV pilus assembly protein PilY1
MTQAHNPVAGDVQPWSERAARRIARALLPALVLALTVQPAAFAAPTQSQLATAPLFVDSAVASNVLFVMDDSRSMEGVDLPAPGGIIPAATHSLSFTVGGSTISVSQREWRFRSSTLNPLYYNPALTYKPWNDNGKQGQSGSFANASIGVSEVAATQYFREGLVPQDMRYKGPNRTYNAATYADQHGRKSLATGSNPGVPSDLPFGGFDGTRHPDAAAPGGLRNQDIFSSPLQLAGVATCKEPVDETIDLLWAYNENKNRKPDNRTRSDRGSDSIQSQERDSTESKSNNASGSVSQLTVVNRPTFADASDTSRAADLGAGTVDTQTSSKNDPTSYQWRVARDESTKKTLYRVESGGGIACAFGAWQELPSPPVLSPDDKCFDTALGGNPNDPESGTLRPIESKSKPASCPDGYVDKSGSSTQCIKTSCNDPSYSIGTGADANFCIKACPTNTGGTSGNTCYQCLASGFPEVFNAGGTFKCMASCDTANDYSRVTNTDTCRKCTGQTFTQDTANPKACYGYCQPGTTTYWDPVGKKPYCLSGCTAPQTVGGPINTSEYLRCYGVCAQGTQIGKTCYKNCSDYPGGALPISGNNTQCLAGTCESGSSDVIRDNATGKYFCTPNCTRQFGSGFPNFIDGKCYANCPTDYPERNPSDPERCLANCPSSKPNKVYTATGDKKAYCEGCDSGFPNYEPSLKKCFANCLSPATVDTTDKNFCLGCLSTQDPFGTTQCIAKCDTANGYTFARDTYCYKESCMPGFPNKPSDGSKFYCVASCTDGRVQSGPNLNTSKCTGCPTGTVNYGVPGKCCKPEKISKTCKDWQDSGQIPDGLSCDVDSRYYPNMSLPALARYFVYVPKTGATGEPSEKDLADSANYKLIEINRDQNAAYPRKNTSFPTPYRNNDRSQGQVERADCTAKTSCTWDEEAQNFANWYTYYRTRLYAAIGVAAEALSGLTTENRLDALRLGYGSLNFVPGATSPYVEGTYPTPVSVDGVDSVGTIVRGVRPFKQTPAPVPASDARQEVFDWLFSIRGEGFTPTREAVDGAGRYLTRTDNKGPWISDKEYVKSGKWETDETSSDHVSCRRNYLIVITDGEWTRVAAPFLEDRNTIGITDFASGNTGGYIPTTAVGKDGPTHTGAGVASGRTYQYNKTTEGPTWATANSATNTLADTTLFWWSRDLRPDLANNVRPIDAPPSRKNEAFWQSMTTYLVGYGISASLDDQGTRGNVAARTAITWPAVDTTPNITTDTNSRCSTISVNGSGCGRRDDVMRAALAARGDFLSATDVEALAKQVAAFFNVVSEQESSASRVAVTSSVVQTTERVYVGSFWTGRWTGQLRAYQADTWFDAVTKNTALPAALWEARLPAAKDRNVLTSIGKGKTGEFKEIGNLGKGSDGEDPQQAALDSSQDLVDYLRGDQSKELTDSNKAGVYRNRLGLIGDIVNSYPRYSKATDFLYSAARKPTAAGDGASAYPAYLADKLTNRRPVLLVGANGGMFHGFDASEPADTTKGRGIELFAYVPRAVYGQLPQLSSLFYEHRYFVDGPVVEGDVYWDSKWRTIAIGTTGAGGAKSSGSAKLGGSVFAIDVTEPEKVTRDSVLWDITGADVDDLGHISQAGVIGSAKDGNWYYFVGNGVESKNDKARLLAINVKTGAVTVLETDDEGGSATAADAAPATRLNGLGGVAAVYDSDRNVVALYAGDRLGRLWKFDLSGVSSGSGFSAVKGTKMFVATTGTDPDLTRQPITAAPRVVAHPIRGYYVVFGTGKFYDGSDKGDRQVQSIYALWEPEPDKTPTLVTQSALTKLTLAAISGTKNRNLSGTDSFDGTSKGFYFELAVSGSALGERVLAQPGESFGFVDVWTYEPEADGDPCRGGGASYLYRLDLAGAFSRSGFATTSAVGVQVSAQIGESTGLSKLSGGSTTSTSSQRKLTAGELKALVSDRKETKETIDCRSVGVTVAADPQAAARLNCTVETLRVWRELPRR